MTEKGVIGILITLAIVVAGVFLANWLSKKVAA